MDATPKLGPPSEYLRVKDVRAVFGLTKGTVYNLIRQGRIETVSLSVTASGRALRLISAESLRRLLASRNQREASRQ